MSGRRQASEDREAAAAAAARAVTPSASATSNESGLSRGQQWWLPQPHPSLDEAHTEWRPAPPMAQALQCTLCKDLLKEAITAVECSHSYCYDCIDARIVVGGKANFCPVCNLLLGPNPWEHNKLKYDFMLDSIVRKVFPRPKLDEALEARRLEREEATRQAKASLRRSRQAFAGSAAQLAAAGGRASGAGADGQAAGAQGPHVEVALFPCDPPALSGSGSGGSKPHQAERQRLQALPPPQKLPKPYLRVPASTTLAALLAWLMDRLAGKKGDASKLPPLQLLCAGTVLDGDSTVQEVHERVWQPHCRRQRPQSNAVEDVMVVFYALL